MTERSEVQETQLRIAPSILSADFAALAEAIDRVAPEADMLHVDVMDGHFVPNLTIGPPVVKSVRKHTDLYLDCHLMMTNPGDFLEAFAKAGANGVSVHIEVPGTADLFTEMRKLGLDVGLAINPDTPFEAYERWLGELDLILIMTVFPGFAGQSFMAEVMPKLAQTHAAVVERRLRVSIEVDGGINEQTGPIAAANGADTFVAGKAIFGADDPRAAARRIRDAVSR